MARGVNKFIGVGTLGKDPEVRHSPNGSCMANISIAVNEEWKDKQTGEKQTKTEWIRIVFFNRLAEIAGEYLKKGSQVYIEGRLQTRKWQGQDGEDKYTTEIVANEMQMLGGVPQNNNQANQSQQQQSQAAPAPAPRQREPGGDDFDTDVPF